MNVGELGTIVVLCVAAPVFACAHRATAPPAKPAPSRPAEQRPPYDAAGEVRARPEPGERYADYMLRVVTLNWQAPDNIPDARLASMSAIVRLKLASDGSLDDARLSRSSGSVDFDSACLSAVMASVPFEPPPVAARPVYARGVLFEFIGKNVATRGH
jgi:TonB family protein